jgi:DNA polymerase sigma
MIIEDSGECSLTDLYNVLCPKEWLKNCHIIKTARVPIIQFKVIVANLKHLKGK